MDACTNSILITHERIVEVDDDIVAITGEKHTVPIGWDVERGCLVAKFPEYGRGYNNYGRREFDDDEATKLLERQREEECKARRKTWPWWKRVFC